MNAEKKNEKNQTVFSCTDVTEHIDEVTLFLEKIKENLTENAQEIDIMDITADNFILLRGK